MGGKIGSTKTADLLDFEVRVARLYVQDKLSTGQIAERLGCSGPQITGALRRCEIGVDNSRRTWKW